MQPPPPRFKKPQSKPTTRHSSSYFNSSLASSSSSSSSSPKYEWVTVDNNEELEDEKNLYWDKQIDVAIERANEAGGTKGGHQKGGLNCAQGESESSKTKDIFRVYTAGKGPLNIFCLHGAGHSAMSWAVLASHMKSKEYKILSYDMRGHGRTRAVDDSLMSVEQLVKDTVNVMESTIDSKEPTIIAGHSLGGSLAVKVAKAMKKIRIVGLVIVDVVEGTAIASLPSMANVVRSRPSSFPSNKDAVNWALKNLWLRNEESASLSIPSQLKKQVRRRLVKEKGDGQKQHQQLQQQSPLACCRYVWRTDLLLSEKYWKNWFKGMTELVVSLKIPKVLILAGRDRMAKDKKLTVAQMQGKFQMVFVSKSGHSIQEDRPEKVAEVIHAFASRILKMDGFNTLTGQI